MPKKKILIGDDRDVAIEFLAEYFSDTKSIPIFAKSKEDALDCFSLTKPHFVFMRNDWVDTKIVSRMLQYRKENPQAKYFSLGYSKDEIFKWDNQFEVPLEIKAFRKTLLGELEFPPVIKLMIVDDEEGILELFKDFFELRKDPRFQVITARNGLEGFEKVEKEKPDCLVLDIKMPVRNGIEMYRDLQRTGKDIPTVIFIDATSAEEIGEVRKCGRPVFVEKGGYKSSMPEMLVLVKKLIYFA